MVEKVAVRLPAIYEFNQTSLYKYLVLICLEKMLSYADETDLKRAIDASALSLFLSKLTASNDIMIVAINLQILDIISAKLPHTFTLLVREGLIEYVTTLGNEEEAQKLKAHLVSNKKPTSTAALGQSLTTLLGSRGNLPPNFLQSLENDPRYENLMNYIQSLNGKAGGNLALNRFGRGSEPQSDPFTALAGLKQERERLRSDAKKTSPTRQRQLSRPLQLQQPKPLSDCKSNDT